MYLSLALIF